MVVGSPCLPEGLGWPHAHTLKSTEYGGHIIATAACRVAVHPAKSIWEFSDPGAPWRVEGYRDYQLSHTGPLFIHLVRE